MVRIPVTSKSQGHTQQGHTHNKSHGLGDPLKSEENAIADTHHLDAATAAPPNPVSVNAQDDFETGDQKNVPDPTTGGGTTESGTTTTENGSANTGVPTGPAVETEAADPTTPPPQQPVDSLNRPFDTLGNVASETEGPAGSDVTAGDITEAQDADQAVEDNVNMRVEEQEMWGRQQSGEVEQQRDDLKPSPGQSGDSLPANPTGSENVSGGAGPQIEENEESGGDTPSGASGGAGSGGAGSGGAGSGGTGSGGTGAGGSSASASFDDASSSVADDAEVDDRLLRLAADFENYKRQAARREIEVRERAVRSVVEDLLPVLDNFERALQAARNAKDVDTLRIGVEYIFQQFSDALKSHGIEPIQAHGKPFDPLHHDALEEVQSEEHPEGTVVEEAQRGYSFKGKVLRPSRVRVASGRKK